MSLGIHFWGEEKIVDKIKKAPKTAQLTVDYGQSLILTCYVDLNTTNKLILTNNNKNARKKCC